ncbi:MAG TPA: hypothetical protein DCS93_19215 [Microscillaceae bacterium]|nr:hypothetical protein [Microscillaceae bacterium]
MKEQLKDEEGKVFFEMEYWADQNLIYCTWTGEFIPVDLIKQGALQMLEKLKTHPTPFLLNDTRQVVGVWDEANDWIAVYWMPEAIKLGLRKFAHIYAEELYARLSAQFMQQNSEKVADLDTFEVRLFKNNQKEALNWLSSFVETDSSQ